jgi:hypothetical protein
LIAKGFIEQAKQAFLREPADRHGAGRLISVLAVEGDFQECFETYHRCLENTEPDIVLLSSLLESSRKHNKMVKECARLVWQDMKRYNLPPVPRFLTSLLIAAAETSSLRYNSYGVFLAWE